MSLWAETNEAALLSAAHQATIWPFFIGDPADIYAETPLAKMFP